MIIPIIYSILNNHHAFLYVQIILTNYENLNIPLYAPQLAQYHPNCQVRKLRLVY